MKYIVHTRFKAKALCGEVNLPAMTECELQGGCLVVDGKPLCMVNSENAHKHFARNDDGNGLRRGALVSAIVKVLGKEDENHQTRWDKVWGDTLCQKFKRTEHPNNWLWNSDFYNASIDDLEHIAELVGANI